MHVHCTFTSTQAGEPILYLFKSQFELCHNNNNNNKNNNNNTLPLPSKGFSGIMKQLFKWNIKWLRFPTGQRQTSWLFTSIAEDLNSGLRENKSSWRSGWDLNLLTSGPLNYKPTVLTTKPCHLIIIMKMHYFPQEVKYVFFLNFIGCCNQTT